MEYSTHMLRRLRSVIGRNIHQRRAGKKMLLGKLACTSGVSADLIDRYELGKNEIRLDELLKIACALDMRITMLLDDDTRAYIPDRNRWGDFFAKGPHVSDDFMTDREQPPVQMREEL